MTLSRRIRRIVYSWRPRTLRAIVTPRAPDDSEVHPERLAVLPYCSEGRGIDVGCGHRKSSQACIGVDLVAGGNKGEHGVVAGKISQADIQASGDNLHMFADGELDFVVARHNLEHYVDPIKALQEWKRVLKSGGVLAVVLPDERHLSTIALDPTHKHVFTPESITRIMHLIGGFDQIELRTVIERWSFLASYRKR